MAVVIAVAVAVLALVVSPLLAATVANEPLAAAADMATVIGRAKTWLIGLAAAVFGAMFAFGTILYMASGIGQKEMGKKTMRDACVGICLSGLATLVLAILQSFVA
ncbi:hypothetical protein [Fodinicola feengrottensis]|uniref:Conjugal transfer protein TrbC n=1 Tax=Fodinicola feengrottensis TaxID=435914 RepID=A0ABP4RPL9_9ACTN|nr:hypothetical protein [Fodinicola feengrottensis]